MSKDLVKSFSISIGCDLCELGFLCCARDASPCGVSVATSGHSSPGKIFCS